MENVNPFNLIPPGGLLYFNYGLAFIFLGIVIVSKDMKGSRLRISIPLKYLACFGFTHGTHEWFELYILFQGPLMTLPQTLMVKSMGFLFNIFSFIFLLLFGSSLTCRISNSKNIIYLQIMQIVIVIIWTCFMAQNFFKFKGNWLTFIQHADIASRYSLAFSGSLITGFALMLYSLEVKKKNASVARNFFRASVAFFMYAILAGLIPSKMSIPIVNAPIEFFRMVIAISITFFIVKALNIFDFETRRMVNEQTKQLIQAEKLASLGQLAAGVAHEINNPLTNASLNIQMIKNNIINRNIKDESLSKKINAVGRNIDRASIIAKELLLFTRTDTEVFSHIDLNTVIQNAIDTLDYKLKNINITQNLGKLPEIKGNHGKLQQVFINIIHNSLEAMKGTGDIEIISSRIDNTIHVCIKDDGVGIAKDKLDKIFDPFYTTMEIGTGTGLGLFICYGIIQQHEGKMRINSTLGQGTTVEIELPVHQE